MNFPQGRAQFMDLFIKPYDIVAHVQINNHGKLKPSNSIQQDLNVWHSPRVLLDYFVELSEVSDESNYPIFIGYNDARSNPF